MSAATLNDSWLRRPNIFGTDIPHPESAFPIIIINYDIHLDAHIPAFPLRSFHSISISNGLGVLNSSWRHTQYSGSKGVSAKSMLD